MSAPKHAPGPWAVQGLAIVAGDRSFVGRVYPWCADPQDAECAKANARLIAAAPDLLDTLEMVMRRGRIDDSEEAMNQVAGAIAKARGEA